MERYAVLEALLLLQGSFHLREATCQNLCLYGVLATATITGIIEMQEKSRCKDSGHSMLSDKGDADNERGMIEKMIEE